MIVRVLLWRLEDGEGSFAEVQAAIDRLEPLDPPSTWLWSDPQERFGALLVDDEPDGALPPQLDAIRGLIGRDPDLYDEFDAIG